MLTKKKKNTYTSILSLSLFVCLGLCPPLATPFYLCLSPIQTQSHMYIMLTHPVSLYPWSASAAQWALILKTEQIKVTVGRAKPATDNTICQVYLCVCVCIYFYCLLPTSKQWHGSRESRCQMAPVPLKEKLTLIAPFLPDKCAIPFEFRLGNRGMNVLLKALWYPLMKTTDLISSCACWECCDSSRTVVGPSMLFWYLRVPFSHTFVVRIQQPWTLEADWFFLYETDRRTNGQTD